MTYAVDGPWLDLDAKSADEHVTAAMEWEDELDIDMELEAYFNERRLNAPKVYSTETVDGNFVLQSPNSAMADALALAFSKAVLK
jgi:hypothetical protein